MTVYPVISMVSAQERCQTTRDPSRVLAEDFTLEDYRDFTVRRHALGPALESFVDGVTMVTLVSENGANTRQI